MYHSGNKSDSENWPSWTTYMLGEFSAFLVGRASPPTCSSKKAISV